MRLKLGCVIGPQVVESKASADEPGFQCLGHDALPGGKKPAVGVRVAGARHEHREAPVRPGQRAQPLHQVLHGRRDNHVLHSLRSAVLLRTHEADDAAGTVDLGQRQVQELNATAASHGRELGHQGNDLALLTLPRQPFDEPCQLSGLWRFGARPLQVPLHLQARIQVNISPLHGNRHQIREQRDLAICPDRSLSTFHPQISRNVGGPDEARGGLAEHAQQVHAVLAIVLLRALPQPRPLRQCLVGAPDLIHGPRVAGGHVHVEHLLDRCAPVLAKVDRLPAPWVIPIRHLVAALVGPRLHAGQQAEA